MPGIVETLYTTYIFPRKTAIVIVIIFIIFAIASYYAYSYYKPPTVFDDVANAPQNHKTAEIMFFSANWCPHCTKAQPEWDAFSNQYNKSVVNGYTIVCTKYDMTTADVKTNDNHSLVDAFNITGYPTVKMRYNDKIIDYDASVLQSSLGKFVNTIV